MNPRARTADLLVRDLSEETLVYDLARHRAHCLNRTAALVWRHSDGTRGVQELARVVARETGLPADEDVVWMALAQLSGAHLLEERVAPPGAGRRSRRDVLKKLGGAAGLAILLPAVLSVEAPTAAQAASPTTWQTCLTNPGANAGKCCTNVNPRKICVRFGGFGLCNGAQC